MQLSLDTDEFGGLTCAVSDGQAQAKVSASNMPDAARDLVAAFEGATDGDCGECYWHEAAGEYRWMFRRSGGKIQVVVLWSTGTLTGWEHVFWSECEFEPLALQLRDEISRLQIPAA